MNKHLLAIIITLLATTLYCQKPYTVGIVLSGGGAKGFAHIGVLQALEDNGIYPEIIAGTSMGALVGAMYAQGLHPKDIFDIIKKEQLNKKSSFLTPSLRSTKEELGLSNHDNVNEILIKYLKYNDFDSLQKPFYLCVSNITEGKGEIKHKGNKLFEYLLGSSSIPGVFTPVKINGKLYVDGGVYNNLPAQPLRNQCQILIASDVNPAYVNTSIVKTSDVLFRSLSLLIYENTKEGRKMCDYVINVPVNRIYSSMDFDKFYSIYQIGYKTGLDFIRQHPELKKKAEKKGTGHK